MYTGFLVNICLSYGSRAEIVMACNAAIAEKQKQQGYGIQGSNCKKCNRDVVNNKDCKKRNLEGDKDMNDGICMSVPIYLCIHMHIGDYLWEVFTMLSEMDDKLIHIYVIHIYIYTSI
jgi:hypothetical protein